MLRGRSECELHRVGVFVRLFDHVVHTRIDTVHISGGNVAMGGRNDGVRGFEREFVSKRGRVVERRIWECESDGNSKRDGRRHRRCERYFRHRVEGVILSVLKYYIAAL